VARPAEAGRRRADAEVDGRGRGLTPAKSAGLGVVVSVVNPKNLILIIGGATAIAQTDVSGADQAIAWAIFILIATIGVAAPVVIYFVIIGVKLIGDAISGFSV
jgi:threonine/homoserine/homoserine lactone efflux protein